MGVVLLIIGLLSGWAANTALRKGEVRLPFGSEDALLKKDTKSFDAFLLVCMLISVSCFAVAVVKYL